MDISGWREKIDNIDMQILVMLNERAQSVREIGRLKKKNDRIVHVPEREAEILTRIRQANAGPYTADQVAAIFQTIMIESRTLQSGLQE